MNGPMSPSQQFLFFEGIPDLTNQLWWHKHIFMPCQIRGSCPPRTNFFQCNVKDLDLFQSVNKNFYLENTKHLV